MVNPIKYRPIDMPMSMVRYILRLWEIKCHTKLTSYINAHNFRLLDIVTEQPFTKGVTMETMIDMVNQKKATINYNKQADSQVGRMEILNRNFLIYRNCCTRMMLQFTPGQQMQL